MKIDIHLNYKIKTKPYKKKIYVKLSSIDIPYSKKHSKLIAEHITFIFTRENILFKKAIYLYNNNETKKDYIKKKYFDVENEIYITIEKFTIIHTIELNNIILIDENRVENYQILPSLYTCYEIK